MTNVTQSAPQASFDLEAIKGRQQVAWSTGDYAVIGGTLISIAESLCDAVGVRAGQTVLDVATGSGNAALAAARRWAVVTACDYVPALLERGRERAAAERLTVTFQQGDAEANPFPDASFDVVLSTLGVMFAPNQQKAADELLRVCKPGGKIGLANWTPGGFLGRMFKVLGQHVPPAPGLRSPMQWGTEARLRELFGDRISALEVHSRYFTFNYRSPQHFIEVFRTYYGPMNKTFGALESVKQEVLYRDLAGLLRDINIAGDAALAVPGEYLEIVAVRR